MPEKKAVSEYIISWKKRTYDLVVGAGLLLFALPVMAFVGFLVVITEGRPVFFIQDRVGKKGKMFRMYKFRTMGVGADQEQKKYQDFNEADGPVFKIHNDPRFIGIGKWLSHTGLDELPQLFNVFKGEMSLVGPRPLPAREFNLLEEEYKWILKTHKPGLISKWAVDGTHSFTFAEWEQMNIRYYTSGGFGTDISICIKAVYVGIQLVMHPLICRMHRWFHQDE